MPALCSSSLCVSSELLQTLLFIFSKLLSNFLSVTDLLFPPILLLELLYSVTSALPSYRLLLPSPFFV